jgi:hypothetical protein
MANPSVVIDIASEFTGKKAFDKAGKSTSGLESAVGSLSKKLAVAFSATAIINFGKAAVKAFAEDEKSAAILANTMKNLGLEFQNPAVESFIAKLSAATGEVDDNLRPAMQKLLQVTGSVSKSQELLTLALDVAAGSGQSLDTVITDLAAAQAGNTEGLKKYSLGLTAAELKTMSLESLTAKLASTFKGSAATNAETFSGQLKILTTAAGEAQETIGKGLVDAFNILSGEGGGMVSVTDKLTELAQNVADITVGMALFIQKLKDIPLAGKGLELFFGHLADIFKLLNPLLKPIIDLLTYFGKLGAQKNAGPLFFPGSLDELKKQQDAIIKAEKEAEARRIAAAKAAAATKIKADKLALAAKQKSDKLAKASAMFDMEKIQLAAALKGKITEDEKLRLQLQQAIVNENDELADKLQKKLEASQIATAKLNAQIVGIKPAIDPFAAALSSLEGIAGLLTKIGGMSLGSSLGGLKNVPKEPSDVVILVPEDPKKPETNNPDPVPVEVVSTPTPTPTPPATNNNNPFAGLGGSTGGGFGFSLPSYLQNTIPQSPVTVNVNVEGSLLTQDSMVKVVADALVIANTNGNNTYRPGAVTVTE